MQPIRSIATSSAIMGIALMTGCNSTNASDGKQFYDFNTPPEALFKEHRTDDKIYLNKAPRQTIFSDVEDIAIPCDTDELYCVEFPFPLIIPRKIGVKGQQQLSIGKVNYVAYHGPKEDVGVCNEPYFVVITNIEDTPEYHQFTFSKSKGLELIAETGLNRFGQPYVVAVYNLVSGRIFGPEEYCD